MDTWENKNDPGDTGNLPCYKNVEIESTRVIALITISIYLRFRIIFVISI